MTSLLRTVPFLLLASSPAVADGPWANKFLLPDILKNPSRPAPDAVTHNFGTVPRGTLCTHKFTVTNIYDVPVQVIDFRKSCACLEAYPPLKVLQPNESAELIVTMDASKFVGDNTQTLYVTFGPTYVSTAVVRLSAKSSGEVNLTPGHITFGTVPRGMAVSRAVTLEYGGRQRDWKVTGVVQPAGPFTVDVKETSRGFVGVKYAVTATLKADAPAGAVSEVVTLKTNDPAAPLVQVTVGGFVQPPLTVSAAKLAFGRVKVGGDPQVLTLVVQSSVAPFAVKSVPDGGDGISVEAINGRGPTQVVRVRFQPTKAGVVRRDVVLATDLPGGPAVTVAVEAEGY